VRQSNVERSVRLYTRTLEDIRRRPHIGKAPARFCDDIVRTLFRDFGLYCVQEFLFLATVNPLSVQEALQRPKRVALGEPAYYWLVLESAGKSLYFQCVEQNPVL